MKGRIIVASMGLGTNSVAMVIECYNRNIHIDLKLFAETLHIWNTGAGDVRVSVNEISGNFTVATAGLIPSGEDQYFVSTRKPIKNFIVATESGTSTVKYTAF